MKKIHLLIPALVVVTASPFIGLTSCNIGGGDKPEPTPPTPPTPSSDCLTFTALEPTKIGCAVHVSGSAPDPKINLQYSINGSDWINYPIGKDVEETYLDLKAGEQISFCGNNPNYFSYTYREQYTNIWCTSFDTTQGKVNVSGNVMSLLDNGFCSQTEMPCEGCFYGLFSNILGGGGQHTNIVNAKDLFLPATTLIDNCYGDMFYRIDTLISAPFLPAQQLVNLCYTYMFYECSSLSVVAASGDDNKKILTTSDSVFESAVKQMFFGTRTSIQTLAPNTTYYWEYSQ